MPPIFKTYCHLRNAGIIGNEPLECAEVSFQASPEILRGVANFMIKCANKMEASQDKEIVHFHLQDELKEWAQDYPDVIVVSPKM